MLLSILLMARPLPVGALTAPCACGDAVTGEPEDTLTGHRGYVWSVAFSPDGATLASSSSDGAVRLWDTKRGRSKDTLTGHTGSVRNVAYAPDGQSARECE